MRNKMLYEEHQHAMQTHPVHITGSLMLNSPMSVDEWPTVFFSSAWVLVAFEIIAPYAVAHILTIVRLSHKDTYKERQTFNLTYT